MSGITISVELTPYKVNQTKKFIKKRFGLIATDELLTAFLQQHPDLAVVIHESIDPTRMDTYDRDNFVDGLTQHILGKGRYWPSNSDIFKGVDPKDFIQEIFVMGEAKGWKVAKLKVKKKVKKKAKK